MAMPDHLIGNYRVVRLLGEGGMGMVYEVVRDDIGVRAAIKVLRSEYAHNADVEGRFFNEARAVNMIQHPGVVRVFDYGRLPTGEAYLAMEFLEGESLRERIHREVRMSEAETMRLGRQIAAAVAAAHAKQIVHRDLKPENVMVIPDGDFPGGERAKVLDFGIAKLESASVGSVRTRTNAMMGTPMYMAPEQCRGLKAISDRADVYALGIIMFEMLTGQPPFVSEAPGDIIAMHMFQPPPPLGTVVPDIEPTFQRLLDAMLAKDPQARPSMAEVAQQLKALGHLQSDVLPMQVMRDAGPDKRPAPIAPAPPPSKPRILPPASPEVTAQSAAAAPAGSRPADFDETVQMREDLKLPLGAELRVESKPVSPLRVSGERPAAAALAPPAPISEIKGQPTPLLDATAALRVDESQSKTKTSVLAQRKRLGLMVFLGLLVVALLLGMLVLFAGGHVEDLPP